MTVPDHAEPTTLYDLEALVRLIPAQQFWRPSLAVDRALARMAIGYPRVRVTTAEPDEADFSI